MSKMQETMEAWIKMQRDGVEVAEPTAKTPVLAVLSLLIAQTHVLEPMKAEGPDGDASKAADRVQKAIELVNLDDRSLSEH